VLRMLERVEQGRHGASYLEHQPVT
jgi:hypothetical protein